jgi:uncharacterized protein YycO
VIRLQFVLGADWSSRLISWYGQGYGGFSHVDAVLSDGSLLGARSDVVGDQPAGVQIRPSNYEKWKRTQMIALQTTEKQASDWEAWLRSQVGMPYDKADIIGLIIGSPIMTAGHWICSALQFQAEKNVGIFPADMPLIDQQASPNTLLACNYAVGARKV